MSNFGMDSRSLLCLATALRRLANEYMCRGDQALYLLTAEALEKRTERLSAVLPQECDGRRDDPKLHKPVDVTV
jgi:hypothetical protein